MKLTKILLFLFCNLLEESICPIFLLIQGCQITCSHVPKEEKEKIQNLIHRMAGVYSAGIIQMLNQIYVVL